MPVGKLRITRQRPDGASATPPPEFLEGGDVVVLGRHVFVGQSGRASTCHLHFEWWTAPGWYKGGQAQDPLDERALSKLRWRCRRGLLENDLFIERFFRRYESRLTVGQARGMYVLMDLSDNDLMDLLLRRKELQPEISTEEVREVLDMLRA